MFVLFSFFFIIFSKVKPFRLDFQVDEEIERLVMRNTESTCSRQVGFSTYTVLASSLTFTKTFTKGSP